MTPVITVRPPSIPAGSYSTWGVWRHCANTRNRRATLPPHAPVWRPCPTCWGQGRILHHHRWETCGGCLGVREIPSL